MFDKKVLQMGKYSLPHYVVNYCMNHLNQPSTFENENENENENKNELWSYEFFKIDYRDKFSEFVEQHPHKKLQESGNILKKLKSNSLTISNLTSNLIVEYNYFIFYYLYTHGGFFINDCVVLEPNIIHFDFTKEIVIVESCVNNDELFNGFIFCHKHNKLIELFLKKIEAKFESHYFENFANTTQFFKEELKNDIFTANSILQNLNKPPTNFVLKEFISNNISFIYDTQQPNFLQTYAKHYFNPVLNFFKLPEYERHLPKKMNIQNLKIGITFNIIDKVNDMFVNGINQNSLYIAELLLNIGYDVYIIVDDLKLNEETKKTLEDLFYDSRFKYSGLTDLLELNFDVLIQSSFSFCQEIKIVNILKYMNTKLVGYFCGNSYIINSEKILYNQHKTRDNTRDCFNFTLPDGTNILDEVWSIPQMVNTNLYYWKTLYRCNCIEAPFIWSNKSLHFTMKYFNFSSENELMYVNRGPNKKIGIFEPNISIMKWSLPCLMICENTYRQNKTIDHIYITNMKVDDKDKDRDKDKDNNEKKINDFNLTTFNHILSSLDIFKNKICSIETRYNTLQFMKTYCDVAVSHQWENPLNYLYFDLAWMGWPIIHNAHLCSDVGYYYEGFNYEMGGNILDEVLKIHDTNVSEYIERNRLAIDKYLPTNEELQNKYKCMIENIMNI